MSEKIVHLSRGGGDMPAPLVPPEVDLRGLHFMQLDVSRLLESDFFVLSSGAEFKAGVALWAKSWLQVPAASLPDDDRILAHLSGAGPAWPEVKAMALRGWVKCSDGRLYHHVVATTALRAWELRQEFLARKAKKAETMAAWRAKKAEAKAARMAKKAQKAAASGCGVYRDTTEMPRSDNVASKRGRERERGMERGTTSSSVSSLRSETAAPASPPQRVASASSEPTIVSDPKGWLFRTGLRRAMSLTGKPEAQVRALIGRWLKQANNDAALVAGVLDEACVENPIDPVPWITAAIKARVQSAPRTPDAGAQEGVEAVPDYGPGWYANRDRKRPWFALYARRAVVRDRGEQWVYGGYAADAAETRFLEAARLPLNWPGDLELLAKWLTEGWQLSVICRVVGEIAERDGYHPPTSLKYFDAAIRAAAKKDTAF